MKRILKIVLGLFLLLFSVLLARTFLVKSRQIQVSAVQQIPLDSKTMMDHLAAALRIQTISYDDSSKLNHAEFLRFHDYLRDTFPLVHSHLSVEKINQYSLLFRWQGTDSKRLPVVLMAHIDVVPVEATPWKHPPFGGEIAGGY